jgi:drug/metabolite transporter (DMT)-like permease
VATILTRKLKLPASKPMSAASQMLAGGAQLLALAWLTGEFRGFDVRTVSWAAWFALLYLIVAGSIVGFTAYIWLLHYESPTKVGTYAYVNPVVAVLVGYFLGMRTVFGSVLVLVSVITISTMPAKRREAVRVLVE